MTSSIGDGDDEPPEDETDYDKELPYDWKQDRWLHTGGKTAAKPTKQPQTSEDQIVASDASTISSNNESTAAPTEAEAEAEAEEFIDATPWKTYSDQQSLQEEQSLKDWEAVIDSI